MKRLAPHPTATTPCGWPTTATSCWMPNGGAHLTLRIGFCGLTHLGQTLRKASELRGFDTAIGRPEECDIVFVTPDVEDHDDLSEVEKCMSWAVELPIRIPVVLVSQVPPGFTRPWLKKRGNIFYQVDTRI